MTVQAFKSLQAFPLIATVANPVFASVLLDGASEQIAWICAAPATGTIDAVGWHTATVTTGDTVDVRLETVSTTTGLPTGTLFGTNTNGAQVVAAADDNVHFTTVLTAGASVTAGDILAVVLKNGTVPGVINIATILEWYHALVSTDFPYRTEDITGAGWSKAATNRGFAGFLRYTSGGTVPILAFTPVANGTSVAPLSTWSTNADRRGIRFKLPFARQAVGFWAIVDLDNDALFRLYDSNGTGILASVSYDKDLRSGTAANLVVRPFAAPVTLAKDVYYRLTVQPNAAANISVRTFSVADATHLDAYDGGQDCHYTTATADPTVEGDWAQTLTQRALMGVMLNAFDDGVSQSGPLIGPGRLVRN